MSFTNISDFQKLSYSSVKLRKQILGTLLKWNWELFGLLFALILISSGLSYFFVPDDWEKLIYFNILNIFTFLIIKSCYQLIAIFSLRKKDSKITWVYIVTMLTLIAWLLCFLLLYNTTDNLKIIAIIGAIGSLLSWIFQDKIKGVATYLHIRTHHLLNIGDWIQIPAKNVDGSITKITLTSVTISNWDTTTSIIPISALSTEHVINLQSMMEGKTYGRRMYKSFTLDTSWFHPLSEDEANRLKALDDVTKYLPKDEIKEHVSNAKLYRLYLYHWLTSHPHISQHPRLIVRWLEQTNNGMPLQIYAFITDSSLMSFEWQQSLIIEHIIESLNWFGLKLYQSPSSFDVSNNNIYLTSKPAIYR